MSLAAPLAAGPAWLALDLPQAPVPGSLELSLGLRQSQRESWALGQDYAWLQDADNVLKLQRRLQGELGLAWQLDAERSVFVAVPGLFTELAPFAPAGTAPSYRLDDIYLRRSQGLGDMRLGMKRVAPEPVFGARVASRLVLTAPTGLGPFEAPQPLAATGEGRWQLASGAMVAKTWGAWTLAADVDAAWQFGKEAVVSPAAPLYYSRSGPVFAGALSGPAWLDGRLYGRAAFGVAWDWHVGEDERQSLSLSAIKGLRTPLGIAGSYIVGTQEDWWALQPELQARFGRFSLLLGWQAPFLQATGLPSADYGELQLRVDYGF